MNETSTITITVQNQLTAPTPSRFRLADGKLRLLGAEAKSVALAISMPNDLAQVGGMSIPSGFQCAFALNRQYIVCSGGPIAAGGSVQFSLDVTAAYRCSYTANVTATADPFSWLVEASETNNTAVSAIRIQSIC